MSNADTWNTKRTENRKYLRDERVLVFRLKPKNNTMKVNLRLFNQDVWSIRIQQGSKGNCIWKTNKQLLSDQLWKKGNIERKWEGIEQKILSMKHMVIILEYLRFLYFANYRNVREAKKKEPNNEKQLTVKEMKTRKQKNAPCHSPTKFEKSVTRRKWENSNNSTLIGCSGQQITIGV